MKTAQIGILSALILAGCGVTKEQVSLRSQSNEAKPSNATTASEPADFTEDDSFDLTQVQLDDVRKANEVLDKKIMEAVASIDAAKAACRVALTKRTKLLDSLGPVAGELSALISKIDQLNQVIAPLNVAIDAANTEYGTLLSTRDGLKKVVDNFDGDFKKKLAAEITKLDTQIKQKDDEIKGLNADIDALIKSLTFTAAAYNALDDKRDAAIIARAGLIQQRADIRATMSSQARTEKKDFEAKLAAAEKALADKGPALIATRNAKRAERQPFLDQRNEAKATIERDRSANGMTVADIPEDCAKLGVVSPK